jgi:glycosyltransferase involved in cell wall biosynthesis
MIEISVICPVYNEERYIEKLIQFFMNSKPESKELILADGLSTDSTREVIRKYQEMYPGVINLIDNPKKYAPFGLNLAIGQAKGEYIARVDAHTIYPLDYFEQCLKESKKQNATNVGGYIESKGWTDMGKAIAYAMSCKFGVGDSDFRTVRKDGYVDTVPFGFWKRSAFDTYGLFDERLVRNQDDEFNLRVKSMGGTIYQSSKIVSEYYVRDSLAKAFVQYYQYGLYKPMVLRKVGSGIRLRHLIPPCFVIYIGGLPLALWQPQYLLPLLLYFILDFGFSFMNDLTTSQKLKALAVFPALHTSYGLGFLKGLFRKNR